MYIKINSLRKVKMRETEAGLHKTVVPAPCLTQKHPISRSRSLYSPHMEKESILHGQGRLCRYSRQLKLNSERIREASNKRNSIGVSRVRVKFLKMPLFRFK